jgi:uncharacterized integral membrane protein (TIGR00697 family)
MNRQDLLKSKPTNLYLVLSAFFICNALIAELTGAKIFSLTELFKLNNKADAVIGMNMSVGVLLWPLVFILSDLLNEYFGKVGVRKISFIVAGLIAYTSVFLFAGTNLPPAGFWIENNAVDASGNDFNIDYAYKVVFRQGINIIIGSILAFLVSQLIDAYAFHYIRKVTGHKMLWIRATGSTLISQVVDSFLILTVAFYLLGNWSFRQVLEVGLVQYIYKVSVAVVLTPLIYVVHYFADRYLGEAISLEIIEKADSNW